MRRLFTINTFIVLTVSIYIGCATETANKTNLNKAPANLAVVTNDAVPNSNMTNVNLPGINSTDAMDNPVDAKNFMTKAAESGMAEIQMAQLALKNASSADVKQFAQKMITDHTKADNELKQLAKKEDVILPIDLAAKDKEMIDKLETLSGAEFDRQYMQGQVAAHEKAVNLFQDQADDGLDADSKAFAAKTLPTLKSHLEMAREINGKLK